MKLENELEETEELQKQLSSVFFQHSFQVSDSIVSNLELVLFTLAGIFLSYRYLNNNLLLTEILPTICFSICIIIFSHFIWKIFWDVKKETIFIIKSLGLQTTTTYHSNFKTSTFIPWHSIEDVIINEAVVMQRVIYYLAVIVNSKDNDSQFGNQSLIPLFVHAQPRLADLKKVYTNIQLVLGK